MKVSYKKLWKILIDQDMKKRDLEKAAGISHYTINKIKSWRQCNYGCLRKNLHGIKLHNR